MQVSSTRDVRVEGGGGQVAAHSGLFALGRFADSLGLEEALSAAVPPGGERAPVHDRGKVLVHSLLMLAGGGEACSDIEHLRAQPVLFGEVASDSTLYRTLRGLGPGATEALLEAVAGVRAGVWERRGDAAGPVVLDIDSTLVEVHSENKQGAAAHFKGGYGFHPMLCATSDGEPLSIKLRAGNAAANNICDHIEVLDAAIAQLPAAVVRGHREGDDAPPGREVRLRVDAAGCSVGIAEACRDHNIGFFMTARSNRQVEAAIDRSRFDAGAWQPALGTGGEPSKRAQVADLTDSADLAGWPARREPLHPGAQRTLFDSGNWRYRGFCVASDFARRFSGFFRPHVAGLLALILEAVGDECSSEETEAGFVRGAEVRLVGEDAVGAAHPVRRRGEGGGGPVGDRPVAGGGPRRGCCPVAAVEARAGSQIARGGVGGRRAARRGGAAAGHGRRAGGRAGGVAGKIALGMSGPIPARLHRIPECHCWVCRGPQPGGYGPVLRSALTPQNIGLVPVVRRVASSVGPAGAILS